MVIGDFIRISNKWLNRTLHKRGFLLIAWISLISIKKPCNVLKPLDLSLAIQFQLKSVSVGGKELEVVLDKKVDTHSCSIFLKDDE